MAHIVAETGLSPLSHFVFVKNMRKYPHKSMAEVFVIEGLGGRRTLKGELPVRGAKNAALKMLAASLLFTGDVSYERIPDIEDAHRMIELLKGLGVTSRASKKSSKKTRHQSNLENLTLSVPAKISGELNSEIAKRFRASIVLTGPMLARRGKTSFPHPGGCVIGERPIDLFLEAYQKMGARVTVTKGKYVLVAPKTGLHGAHIFFRTPTVTGTETLLMAGILATGETVLENAAMEPEIVSLADWLISCGAEIVGAGTPTIRIRGGKLLVARHPGIVIPDRIEAGSFLVLAALAAKDVRITNCDVRHMGALLATLEKAGVTVEVNSDGTEIRVRGKQHLRGVNIKTHEYPGLPTDIQSPLTVFLTQSKGESFVFETIFESRLSYVESLQRMGADIKVMDPHRILVLGPTPLRGKLLESPDLRAGLSYIIAAIIAKGESVIHQVYYIDRGYEAIEKRLQAIGVSIRRSVI